MNNDEVLVLQKTITTVSFYDSPLVARFVVTSTIKQVEERISLNFWSFYAAVVVPSLFADSIVVGLFFLFF